MQMTQNDTFVIYSANEFTLGSGAGFWSNRLGWTSLDGADRIFKEEMNSLYLPMSLENDRKYVPISEASILEA